MRLDVPGAHRAGEHRYDFLVETGEAPLVLADQHRIGSTPAVAGDVQHDPLAAGVDGLAGRVVTVVAGLPFGCLAQVDIHLDTQHAFGQELLQLRGQRLKFQRPAAPSLADQLIQELARYQLFHGT